MFYLILFVDKHGASVIIGHQYFYSKWYTSALGGAAGELKSIPIVPLEVGLFLTQKNAAVDWFDLHYVLFSF